jgi:ribosomal protein S18 acetylase RimI-like enzyme
VAALRLRPMSHAELADCLPRMEESYLRQLVAFGGMDEAEARAKSTRDHASLFPEGRLKDDHFALVVEAAGEAIGWVVYALRPDAKAWLYDIELDASARGKGHGREAMRLFENHARSHGVHGVALNVWAGNEAARSLYRKTGYSEQSVWMSKSLDSPL